MQSITWWEDFKFLFDFLNSQTRQTNGGFKSCNSHINACLPPIKLAATPPRPKANAFTADWTLGCRSETNSQSSGDDEAAESTSELAMSAFTDAMEKLNPVATGAGRVSPLTF